VRDEEKGKINIWYLDEAGFNVNNVPSYGWAPKGKSPGIK